MPGGRNGSAIYNLYKLKYKKTRRLQAICETILRESSSGSTPPPVSPRPGTPAPEVRSSTEPLNLSAKDIKQKNEVASCTTIRQLLPTRSPVPMHNKNLIQVNDSIYGTLILYIS